MEEGLYFLQETLLTYNCDKQQATAHIRTHQASDELSLINKVLYSHRQYRLYFSKKYHTPFF